jgi:DNA-directed RNA polymerase specialized sigma24 family protein
LANAIAALRAVLQLHFRDPADLDEVVQSACVRLVQAIHKAGTVDSPAAFLHSVWREERAMLLRERARWQRLGEAGDLPVEELALAAAADGFTEEEVRSIGAALPGSLGAWLLDHVSGRSDEDLAAKDRVTTAAIRQRWRQLRGYFLAEGVLPKILDEQGLVELEEDIVSGLTSVWGRRAKLHPTSQNYDVALATFNATEAMMVAELADLKDGRYLLVNEEFTKRQFWLQRSYPDYLFVLMSPKASHQGHAYVAFCLDLKHRHRAVRETRELRRAAHRAQSR